MHTVMLHHPIHDEFYPHCSYILRRGNVKLRNHMEIAHQQDFPPSRPDPAQLSLGDYLCRLERKVEHCTNLLTKQSNQLEKLLTSQDAKLQSQTPTTSAIENPPIIEIDDETQNQFKCDYCPFTTDNKSQLNIHNSGKHSKELSLVACPLCSFIGNYEPEVTKHVQDHHPDIFNCGKCNEIFNSEASLRSHATERHFQCIACPLCSFKSKSEPEVTKHVQDHHPDTFKCGKCNKVFNSDAYLKSHATLGLLKSLLHLKSKYIILRFV